VDDAGRTKYAPASGLAELRAAVVHRYREDFDVRFAPEEVCVAVGGKQALALLYQAILDRGSEIVVPIPAWPTFAEAARVAGAIPVFVPLNVRNALRVTARGVARAITPKTRAVVVNSPSNPTGAVVEPQELLKIYDDTYAHLVFRTAGPPALQEVKDAADGHLVVVGTVSKTYCMTGWRVGWVMGPRALTEACTALNSHSVQGPATFSQVAAAEALTAPQDVVREMAAEYRRRRDFVHPWLAAIPGVACTEPEGGFYVFPDVSRWRSKEVPDTIALCRKLLEEKAVAVVPGEGFHAPGFFRLSFATAFEDLQEGARRIAEFLAERAPRTGGRT
jgi:aspartate aminotransferase